MCPNQNIIDNIYTRLKIKSWILCKTQSNLSLFEQWFRIFNLKTKLTASTKGHSLYDHSLFHKLMMYHKGEYEKKQRAHATWTELVIGLFTWEWQASTFSRKGEITSTKCRNELRHSIWSFDLVLSHCLVNFFSLGQICFFFVDLFLFVFLSCLIQITIQCSKVMILLQLPHSAWVVKISVI